MFFMKLPTLTHNKAVIDEYINFLELQDKKTKTIETKVWGLLPLLEYIGERDLRSVTKGDVEGFILALKKSGRAASSIHTYTFSTRFFFKWLLPDNDFFKNVKVKRPKIDHSKKEFVNINDVKKMLQVCKTQRDRAFLFLMWESAGRLEEILQLNIEDAVPEKNGITVHLRGKTGERDVLVIDAVPDLMSWLNLHRGEKGQPLFPITGGTRLTHTGAQSLIERIAKRAKIEGKKVHPHSFRHGRISELANLGMTEMQLRLFAGWQDDSDMPATYIHTKKKDVYSKLLKLKGIEPAEEETNITATAPKRCPNCGTENPFDATGCYICRTVLDPKLAVEIANEENKRKREIEQLKKEIEQLKKAEKEREELRKEFAPIFEEGRQQKERVEEVTGMDYDDASGYYNVAEIAPNSPEMKEHFKRLAKDKDYRQRYRTAMSGKVEKQQQEIEHKLFKTFAEKL